MENRAKTAITCMLMLVMVGSIGSMLSASMNNDGKNKAVTLALQAPVPRIANAPGSSDQSGDEWPMFHGALNHTGVAVTTPVNETGPAWTYDTYDHVYSSPAVANGRVYVCSEIGKIYCINAVTGAYIWGTSIGSSVDTSPAVAGGRVYVGSSNHKLYCFNASTGAQIWNYTTGYTILTSSPAVTGGRVYVGSHDMKVHCVNATNGTSMWNCTALNAIDASPAVADGQVFIIDDAVHCINATTGTLKWSNRMSNHGVSSPTIANGRVYAGNFDHQLICLNETTGAVIWNNTGIGINSVTSTPAISGGCVYIGGQLASGGNFYCLKATTGEIVWQNASNNYYIDSSPAVACGRVYAGSSDYKVYCLNATTGFFAWAYTTGDVVWSSPAISGGHVYVGSMDGKLYCLPMIMIPFAPQNLNATSGNGKVTLSWQVPTSNGGPIVDYKVFRGLSPSSETFLAFAGNVTSYFDTSVVIGHRYYYTTVAITAAGDGVMSSEVTITVTTVIDGEINWPIVIVIIGIIIAAVVGVTIALYSKKHKKKSKRTTEKP
ncbi:MAG TPA: PQQ-binding-like beta-propeller repeat protein [Candidatus Lokiarchaeia archaeon]|nr:PQQ-binding-like beta-propeller repeat protein [Candidatus Lokiarchaeia archaeon]